MHGAHTGTGFLKFCHLVFLRSFHDFLFISHVSLRFIWYRFGDTFWIVFGLIFGAFGGQQITKTKWNQKGAKREPKRYRNVSFLFVWKRSRKGSEKGCRPGNPPEPILINIDSHCFSKAIH